MQYVWWYLIACFGVTVIGLVWNWLVIYPLYLQRVPAEVPAEVQQKLRRIGRKSLRRATVGNLLLCWTGPLQLIALAWSVFKLLQFYADEALVKTRVCANRCMAEMLPNSVENEGV